ARPVRGGVDGRDRRHAGGREQRRSGGLARRRRLRGTPRRSGARGNEDGESGTFHVRNRRPAVERRTGRGRAGDVVIDAGNSYFRDSLRRAARVKESGIHFIDCGTSGGIGGEKEGYCLMIGGEPEPVELARPVFEAL